MKIKDLIIYPIKSLGGISVSQILCLGKGMQYDRRMMLADENGKFITQRNCHHMAMIGSKFQKNGFLFYNKRKESDSIFIPHAVEMEKRKEVIVWKHKFDARTLPQSYSDWFSEILSLRTTLFKMDNNSIRKKSLTKAPSSTLLSMADGYPYLIISEASLSDLNRRLIVPVNMNRFRANIIIENCKAYQEEEIDKFSINNLSFRMIKPCARCVMTTIDQKTGKKLVEPIKTLSTYKKKGNNIYFGVNAINLKEGMISVGDKIIQ